MKLNPRRMHTSQVALRGGTYFIPINRKMSSSQVTFSGRSTCLLSSALDNEYSVSVYPLSDAAARIDRWNASLPVKKSVA
eukprot:CAMPEP_0113282230 /NCGR_PEP_ID=MMETSP0008_2-20120614/28743_1 /TAXON_ID=97485 /ORGANISM="Prymnesium parvum" /LENGTH=79 /DNA_ID=CAMNT_0000132739 /DNA_START=140 /DNA_END=380 /DNA_ORIENTATION=- /assembly_acc=CAM_ASM_000153